MMFGTPHAIDHEQPMTLGSPSGGQSGLSHDKYLPGYLLGEHASTPKMTHSSRLWSGSSPPRSALRSSSALLSTSISGSSQTPRSETRTSREVTGHSRAKDKAGAPPVMPLIEQLSSSQDSSVFHRTQSQLQADYSQQSSYLADMSRTPGAVQSSIFSPSCSSFTESRKNPPSPAQVDPFYTQGESILVDEELDGTWVTIFGFPPAGTSYILQQFSQYGNVLKHVIATEGNWMHIHYQSIIQAKKALSKNGKIFGGSIMKVMFGDDGDDPAQTLLLSAPSHVANTTANGSMQRHTPIRPLTAAYKASGSDRQVIQGSHTPHKNNNVISKAMEYMFGW